MCDAHPFDTDQGLACVRADDHERGHVYASAWLADRHTDEGDGDV
jgi:hypothetical protein